ncbi:RagB/SusD domain-containing protein [gut metagenome]|uniref:RagB/SusD domain-containing protein n=1 Tax=gut metagenome TaxID=749906 RepID=J9H3S4_9ZZZZ
MVYLGAPTHKIKKVNADGYVYFFDAPQGWLDHYYLFPIPLNQLALNPKLEQNPGWEN